MTRSMTRRWDIQQGQHLSLTQLETGRRQLSASILGPDVGIRHPGLAQGRRHPTRTDTVGPCLRCRRRRWSNCAIASSSPEFRAWATEAECVPRPPQQDTVKKPRRFQPARARRPDGTGRSVIKIDGNRSILIDFRSELISDARSGLGDGSASGCRRSPAREDRDGCGLLDGLPFS